MTRSSTKFQRVMWSATPRGQHVPRAAAHRSVLISATTFALLFLIFVVSTEKAEANSLPSQERVETLCRSWTTSPCVLRVAGILRSARSGRPLSGKMLRFVAGDTLICKSATDDFGRASCFGVAPSGQFLLESGYQIVFDGDDRFIADSARGSIGVRSSAVREVRRAAPARTLSTSH